MIILPIVILARAVLLIFQIGSEYETQQRADEPASLPPGPGQVLRFLPGMAGLETWAGDADRRPLTVVLLEKNLQPQPQRTACLLDPGAMGQTGGELTLRKRTDSGLWRADWTGHRTTRTRDEVDVPEPDPAIRAAEEAVLDGADCGTTARVELSEEEVEVLVDVLSGRRPAMDVAPARAGLNIRAVLPEDGR